MYKLLILWLFFFIFTSGSMASDKPSINKIEIKLNSTKLNGKGWDALRNAPDIVICIVTDSHDHCYIEADKKNKKFSRIQNPLFQGQQFSQCQNSYNCIFEINKPLDELTGLIILDVDPKNNDYVDAVILIGNLEPEGNLQDNIKIMDERLRNISYKYSQVFTEAEKRRRKKKVPVCEVQKDREKICELKQSRIVIN